MYPNAEPAFLSGDSTVEQIIHSNNWSSPLGHPSLWPQALQYAGRFMLDSKSTIFIGWGPELCVLYNDAYIDVLGDRHPESLGKPLRLVWPEVWEQIQPLTTKALSGLASRYQDFHFTLHRDGKDQDAWFTFSLTPLRDLEGNVHGFYCILLETTEQVLLQQRRQAETSRIYSLFESSPSFMAVLVGPQLVYEMANTAYLQFVGERQLVGRSIKEIFPEAKGQGYFNALDQVYASGKPFVGRRLPVTLHRTSKEQLETRYIDFVFQPIRDAVGKVIGIFIDGNDVTEHVHVEGHPHDNEQRAIEATRMLQAEQSRLTALLEALPVGIGFADMNGAVTLMNSENLRLWGNPPATNNVDKYAEWKGWWADGSARHGQRLLPHEWGLARALNRGAGRQ